MTGEQQLAEAIDRLLAERSAELPEGAALCRLAAVLVQAARLDAVILDGVTDLDRRQLYSLADAGSAAGWLRTQPAAGGVRGRVSTARRLADSPSASAALQTGRLALRSVERILAAVDRLPTELDPAAVRAVLLNGIPQTVPNRPAGDPLLPELTTIADDPWLDDPERLTAGLVTMAQRLPAAVLAPTMSWLLDALTPDAHADRDTDEHESRDLDLVQTLDRWWKINGWLEPDLGQYLHDLIEARRQQRQHDTDAAAATEAANDDAANGDPANGDPANDDPANDDATSDDPANGDAPSGDAASEPGEPLRPAPTATQQRYDAFADILRGLAGNQLPTPTAVSILVHASTLAGHPGSLPARTLDGRSVCYPELMRRLCDAAVTPIYIDPEDNRVLYVGGTHRSFTGKERAAAMARCRGRCQRYGCGRRATVPHHANIYALTGHSCLDDLVMLCEHCHRDLHHGQHHLRLTDGRTITPTGWGPWAARAGP